jgi:hypothetical protein
VTGPPQPAAGIQKQIEVHLRPGSRARITAHQEHLRPRRDLCGLEPSVLRPGGRALLPLDVGEPTAFDAIRRIILWSYTEIEDPRYRFGNALVQIDQSRVKAPPPNQTGRRDDESKIGLDSGQGWAATNGGTLFLKRPHDPKGTYPDGGSTIEVYSSSEFLELENLAPSPRSSPARRRPAGRLVVRTGSLPEDEAGALRGRRLPGADARQFEF